MRLDGHTRSVTSSDCTLPRVGLSYVVSERVLAGGRPALEAAGRLRPWRTSPGALDALRTWPVFGRDGGPAFLPDRAGNPKLGPERTAGTEVGFEGAFFGERLAVDATFYQQTTSDALFPVTQIPSLGFAGTQLMNVGSLRNRGVELALNGTVVRGEKIGWDVALRLATNHSKVLDLGGAPPLLLSNTVGWILEGEPAPVLRGLLVKNPDEIADPEVEADHVFGPALPTLTLGIETALDLPGGMRLSARGEYQGGHYIADNLSRSLAGDGVSPLCEDAYELLEQGLRDRLTAWDRLWCVEDAVPRDAVVRPADFFRLRDVTLQVPLPLNLLHSDRTTLTVSMRNWWTWKNDELPWFDPEITANGGMHTAFRFINGHVPAPATLTVSIRSVH